MARCLMARDLRDKLAFAVCAAAALTAALTACQPNRSGSARPNVVDVGRVSGRAPDVAPRDVTCSVDAELARLTKPVKVVAYLPRGTPALASFSQDVVTRLERYRARSHDLIAIEQVDTSTAAGKERAAKTDLYEVELGPGETVYSGVTMAYDSATGSVRALRPDTRSGLDYALIAKLREVRESAEKAHHTIGVLAGHGERTLDDASLVPSPASGPSPTLGSVARQYFPTYRFSSVDLHDGAAEVPDALEGLLVLAPERELSAAELARIDAFVMRGKSLVVITSAAHLDEDMGAELRPPRLARLLVGYGIDVHEDVVLDHDHGFQAFTQSMTGPSKVSMPAIVRVGRSRGGLEEAVVPFFGIDEIGFPYPSSVSISPDRQPNAQVRVVAYSSPRAMLERSQPLGLGIGKSPPPHEPFARVGLAAITTGRLRPAFGGASSGRPARVAAFASESFLANPFTRPRAKGAAQAPAHDELAMFYARDLATSMILAFKNVLDWMALPDELLACASPKE